MKMTTNEPSNAVERTISDPRMLIESGLRAAERAVAEARFAETAANDLFETGNPALAPIAIWHFESALRNYRDAVADLENAKRFELDPRETKTVESRLAAALEGAYQCSRKRRKVAGFRPGQY